MKLLIQNGAHWNAIDKKTAILTAARKGHADLAKVLIQSGADVNAVDKYGLWHSHIAVENGHVDVTNVLIRNGADVDFVSLTL